MYSYTRTHARVCNYYVHMYVRSLVREVDPDRSQNHERCRPSRALGHVALAHHLVDERPCGGPSRPPDSTTNSRTTPLYVLHLTASPAFWVDVRPLPLHHRLCSRADDRDVDEPLARPRVRAFTSTFKSALAPASPGTGAGGSCTTVTPGW